METERCVKYRTTSNSIVKITHHIITRVYQLVASVSQNTFFLSLLVCLLFVSVCLFDYAAGVVCGVPRSLGDP